MHQQPERDPRQLLAEAARMTLGAEALVYLDGHPGLQPLSIDPGDER